MRSRATTYVLIAVVLAVWGGVLWRVFGHEDVPAVAALRVPAQVMADDTLLLDYRDPFVQEDVVERPSVIERPAEPQPPRAEHRLRYLGRISMDGAAYALVEINGSLHTMRRGETAEGYRLEMLWNDSIRMRWRDEICVAKY